MSYRLPLDRTRVEAVWDTLFWDDYPETFSSVLVVVPDDASREFQFLLDCFEELFRRHSMHNQYVFRLDDPDDFCVAQKNQDEIPELTFLFGTMADLEFAKCRDAHYRADVVVSLDWFMDAGENGDPSMRLVVDKHRGSSEHSNRVWAFDLTGFKEAR